MSGAPSRPASQRVMQQLVRAKQRFEQGQRDGAIDDLRRLLRASPDQPEALALLAQLHLARGERDQALFCAKRLAQAHPKAAAAHSVLGRALASTDDRDAALRAYARAIELDPKLGDAYGSRGTLLLAMGRAEDACDDFARAAELLPDQPQHLVNLGQARLEAARATEAVRTLAQVRMPTNAQHLVASSLATAANYDHTLSREDVARAHFAYGKALEPLIRPMPPVAPGPADKRLRVGIFTRDLHRHSCAFFLEPLLEHADRERVELVCIHADAGRDEITARLRSLADGWSEVHALDNARCAQTIRGLEIDVLVECCGHFFGRRLETMALRPAPLSMTYLGYPNTTGLTRIDTRLVDHDTDPDEPAVDALATERLIRLDRPMHCYSPPADAPDALDWPEAGAPFTFASFNQIKKVTPAVLDAWAQILARAPGSRLLLKARALEDDRLRARITHEFVSRGIDEDRLDVRASIADATQHLALYRSAHLALDTFPYHGTTTTLEAAWMGVPTLTLAGDRHASRVGVSLSRAMGADALIASSVEAYVESAVRLATEPDELRARRAGLRERLASSALCDGPGFADAFERAVRTAWEGLAR